MYDKFSTRQVTKKNKSVENYLRYDQFNTVGFYKLNKTLKSVKDPTNIYIMVSDANVPKPLYDVDVSSWTDEDWGDEENRKLVAYSLFAAKDSELMDFIKSRNTKFTYEENN